MGRVKKMKHLLQALPRWREQRVAWKATVQAARSPLDAALEVEFELVPSKKHNDLLLRCVYKASLQECHFQPVHDVSVESIDYQDLESISDSSRESALAEQEIAMLRAENESLRNKNFFLEQQSQHQSQEEVLRKALCDAELMVDLLDDPSEPPPSQYWGNMCSPSGSTGVPSDFGFSSGC